MVSGAAVWLTGCAAAPLVGVEPTPRAVVAGAAVCALGGILPDADHPRSIVSNCLPPLSNLLAWVTRVVSRLVYRATATDRDDPRRGTHRAFTHTVPFAALVGVAAFVGLTVAGHHWPVVAGWAWLGLPLGLGCLTHIFGDALTHSGVPLGWPLVIGGQRWRRLGAPLRFSTGKGVEAVFGVFLAAVGFAALWVLLPGLVHGLPVQVSSVGGR